MTRTTTAVGMAIAAKQDNIQQNRRPAPVIHLLKNASLQYDATPLFKTPDAHPPPHRHDRGTRFSRGWAAPRTDRLIGE